MAITSTRSRGKRQIYTCSPSEEAKGPQTLRVTTIKEEPYAVSKGSEMEGFCIDLLSAVSKKLDFKYDIQLVKDGRYGFIDVSGNWNGMIGEVVRGEADIAVAPLILTAKRETAVDMSKPFMQTGLSFILVKDLDSDDSQFLGLLNPFSTEMWIGVLVAYLLTSACIFLVSRISPCEWKQPEKENNCFTLSHSFWYTVGALTLQGSPLMKNLSVAILHLTESGELDYLRSKWWANNCVAKNGKPAPLKPAGLKGIFLLLALGLGLGLFLALMELATKSRKIANTQQKSCCSVMSAELSQRFRGDEVAPPEWSETSKA